jgi:hypothetical protein
MDIGKEKREIVVTPIETPIPQRRETPAPARRTVPVRPQEAPATPKPTKKPVKR